MVSPVRMRVPPLVDYLQMEEKHRISGLVTVVQLPQPYCNPPTVSRLSLFLTQASQRSSNSSHVYPCARSMREAARPCGSCSTRASRHPGSPLQALSLGGVTEEAWVSNHQVVQVPLPCLADKFACTEL